MRKRMAIVAALAALAGPAVAGADGGPIMPLSEVQPGMNCTGETVIQGTTITPFAVHVIRVVDSSGEGPRILVSVSGSAVQASGVAEGFSGSPVMCPDATGTLRNAGAISEGIGQFGNNVVLVTPIEQMLGEPVLPPPDLPRLAVRPQPLRSPLEISGLSPAWLALVERAAHRAGRALVAAPAAAGSGAEFPVQTLVPGAAVGTQYSLGAIAYGAVGTVTYVSGGHVYAFGHELDGAGRRELLLTDAYVYDVIANPSPGSDTSYKLASPGHVLGNLTADEPNAVIGVLGAPPPTIAVNVSARDEDTGATLAQQTEVADETDVGQPTGASNLSAVAPLAVGQAATAIYDGAPAYESGRLCLSIAVLEAHRPLGFCRRYSGSGGTGESTSEPPELSLDAAADVSNAVALIDDETFAPLHVTNLTAHIEARRGLERATLLAAAAPEHVRAGGRVRVKILVRPYRSALRTLRFTLRVPPGVHGRMLLRLAAAGAGGSGSGALLQQLITAFGGGSSSGSAPQSLPELRADIAAIAPYDGLVAHFGRVSEHAYRNPRLIITGQALVPLIVSR